MRSCAKLCEVDFRVTWREKRCERCNSEPGVAPKINLMQSLSDVSLTTSAYASIERSNGVVDHRRRGEGSKRRAWTNCCSQRECTPFRSRCASPDRGNMCWQPPHNAKGATRSPWTTARLHRGLIVLWLVVCTIADCQRPLVLPTNLLIKFTSYQLMRSR